MQTYYRKAILLMSLIFGASTVHAGGDRDIGDGTLPLGILPVDGDLALTVREEAQSLVGFLTKNGVSLPLREVVEHNDGQVTLLFGEAANRVGLTGTLETQSFTGNMFLSTNPSAVFPVEIAR